MRLSATIRGATLGDLMTNAHAACVRFFGDTPYQIIIQDWDQAYAEYDEAGTLTGFQFSMLAIKAQ